MGYCAKARIYSHIYCVIALSIVSDQVKEMHGASKGSSWPSMKTYDIWGAAQNKADSLNAEQRNKTSNDMVIQNYRYKTSFRNEKGMEYPRNCVNSICFFLSVFLYIVNHWWCAVCVCCHKIKHNKWVCSSLLFESMQCWASLHNRVKMNANQKMVYGPVFVWTFMIAIKKAAQPKDSVHSVSVLVVCVSLSFSSSSFARKCFDRFDFIWLRFACIQQLLQRVIKKLRTTSHTSYHPIFRLLCPAIWRPVNSRLKWCLPILASCDSISFIFQ